ncbi:hypothetical protein FB639_002985 [Coemansia asiatica]|nr:hypothetical protein FB639_002985 [Coemansia asiatica]
MTNPHVFPQLHTSPNVAAGTKNGYFNNSSPQMLPIDGVKSLPGTPQYYFTINPAIARNVWVMVRRDRRSRLRSILQGRSAKGLLPQALDTKDEVELAYSKDLARAIRLRAREVGWMFGIRTRPKTTYLSSLANALRGTLLDEDDAIDDAVQAAERDGVLQSGKPSSDFEDIQEIVAVRNTFRHLLRLRLEHPDPAVRKSINSLMSRINNPKKNLRVPPVEPMTNGPSFYFPASKFSFANILASKEHALDGGEEDAFSSSSEDMSDDEADSGFQRIGVSQSSRGSLSKQDSKARAMYLGWVNSYEATLNSQWPNGAPHLMQLLAPLPKSGYALLDTFNNLFRLTRSGLRESDAHYLFGVAAAQVGCLPLVYLAESHVLDTCYNGDGDAHETAMSYGLQAAAPRLQLLARFSQMLESRPWAISGDDVRALIGEYVRLYWEQQQLQQLQQQLQQQQQQQQMSSGLQGRPRGDSAVSHNLASPVQLQYPSPRLGPVRTNSSANASVSEYARRSIEEAAVRDLLHATILAAVAHGLGSMANACGLSPDLDQRAGSYFTQLDRLMGVESAPGLDFVQNTSFSGAPLSGNQIQPRLSAAFVETVERNTTELISRIFKSAYSSSSKNDGTSVPSTQQSSSQPQRGPLPPPSSVLRTFTGAESRVSAYYKTLGHVIDPMTNPGPQYAAYRIMRARKLAKYEQQPPNSFLKSPASSAKSPSVSPGIGQSLAGLKSLTFGQPALPVQPSAPKSVHLSQSENLRWDVISDYLRQQLSINEDHLGNEVQTARNLQTRKVFDSALDALQSDAQQISLFEKDVAPIHLPVDKAQWDASADEIAQQQAMDLKPKSFSMAGILSMASANANANSNANVNVNTQTNPQVLNRSIDIRQFHDAVWHFTLSLFHIYEEYYFYSKFKGETSPEASQEDEGDHEGAIPVPFRSAFSNTCTPNRSFEMDVENNASSSLGVGLGLGFGKFASPTPNSSTSPHYQKWLTEELKAHIRAVVRHPESISGLGAQPPVATGLNLCVEEMIHINLIVSLARRQAEIIHAIRAIREYEGLSSP